MQKDFFDELMEELQKLKADKNENTLPVPPSPHEVFRVVIDVAEKHNVTADEMRILAANRPISQTEFEIMRELEDKK